MPLDYRPTLVPPWWRSRRLLSVALVAIVHVVLIVFLLSSLKDSRLLSPREIFIVFRAVPPARLPQRIEPPVSSQVAPPLFHYAPSHLPVLILPPSPKGLALSLFGCAPENLANLTLEERTHCGGRIDAAALRGAYPGVPLDRSLQAERWSLAIRDRKTPIRVPCTYAERQPDGSGAMMLDLVCLARLAAHGR